MTHTLRRAEAADVVACVSILQDYIDRTDWLPITLDEQDELVAGWQELFAENAAWVAEQDGCIVGFCERDVPSNNIGALYVVPEARSQGIGKGLLDLAKAGCDHILVWAFEPNAAGRRFYRREGLVEVSREMDDESGVLNVEHSWRRTAAEAS